jgi:hypothetical protein
MTTTARMATMATTTRSSISVNDSRLREREREEGEHGKAIALILEARPKMKSRGLDNGRKDNQRATSGFI